MRTFTVSEFIDLNENEKRLAIAFIDGHYFNLNDAIQIFQNKPKLFNEDMVTSKEYRNHQDYHKEIFIKHVGSARYLAAQQMQELPILFRYSLEFFTPIDLEPASDQAFDIIMNYRKIVEQAYAILY